MFKPRHSNVTIVLHIVIFESDIRKKCHGFSPWSVVGVCNAGTLDTFTKPSIYLVSLSNVTWQNFPADILKKFTPKINGT